nr:DNA-directed DNA polymerase [Tanacetum cinerariifolium]
MRTRSNFYPFNSTATILKRSNKRRVPNIVEPEIRTIEEVVPMADRTMEELLQAPTEGYGEAIVILKILAENFEIKTNLLQLVQANKFHGFERDNPNTHISNFKRMTATLKYRDVPNDAIKLMLFPYSLEGAARIWYEKEPPNSILTWDDLVNKFVNKFFPPSKTTYLKNKNFRFTQRFEETFGEAWDRFKEMLRACPHHGFSELTQIDTFYNGLNEQDQDSLNAAAGGNLLNKTTREALKIIENKSKVRYSRSKSNVSKVNTNSRDSVSKTDDRIDKLADQISNLVEIVNKQVITPATAKAVEKTCVTCGGAHAYYDCIATDGNQPSVCAATGSYNRVSPPNRASHQIPPPVFAPGQNNPNRQFLSKPGLNFGTLPSNTVPNPKGEMKAVTTCSGLAYEGPSIPTNSPLEKVVEQNTEEIMDKEHSTFQGSTTQFQPLVVPISILEPNVPRTQPKPTIPYPSRLNDQKLPKVPLNENYSAMLLKKLPEKLRDLGKFLIHCDFHGMDVCHALADLGASINLMPLSIWKKLSLLELTPTRMTLELADRSITRPKGVAEDVFVKVGKLHFPTDFVVVNFEADPRVPLILGSSFLRTSRALIDVYGEEITLRSSNPTLLSDPSISKSDSCKEPIFKSSSPTLTPFGESDFFLEEIEDFLNDDSIPTGIDDSLYDPEGDILYLENPWVSPINYVPKKGGMTIIANENNELIPTRLVISWRVCIDYRKLNDATRKDHFPLPFMDQMLERLAGNEFYCFLDGFSEYFQISIDPQDQEEKTFTCPYETFAYRRMPFGLCNAPGTFQREGIVLGHKILKYGIEVDRAKVDVIAKLPHPTTVKGVRSFLGHAGFYCRFIQDFSKIARPMTYLLERETPFVFSKECVNAFDTLKKKLTEALILRKTKHFQPIHYASKTMTEAQIHYTTTDKEMLAVIIRRCVHGQEAFDILKAFHEGPTGTIMVPISQRRKFGIPRAIISDCGTRFCNDQFTRVMIKYGVTHRLATAYHPQTSGQVEVSNHGLKHILERTVGENRASWAYWALKQVNFDLKTTGDHRKLQLNELNELRDQAYENSMIYKERIKKLHDSKIKNRIFNVGDQVLLFNSRLKIFSWKLKTRWSGPFTITQIFSYGTVELSQPNGPNFKVNGHCVKHYFRGDIPFKVVSDIHTFSMDK